MLNIRSVQPQDIFSVIKIAYESLPERYNPSIFTMFYECFPQGFLIAEINHKIVGFLIGIKTDNQTAKILMLSVNKKHRKNGIGSKMIINFLREMHLLNINKIYLEVRINNLTAINFYKKHGFDIKKKIKNFYQNGEDAYIMGRDL